MSHPISVVFIDDEAILMDFIREGIAEDHPEWRTRFFIDPVDGLEHVRAHAASIDVVVCDICMPFASGIEILAIIGREFPTIGRITLSGRIDSKTIIDAGRAADLNLCKPLRLGTLCEGIRQVHAARRARSAG